MDAECLGQDIIIASSLGGGMGGLIMRQALHLYPRDPVKYY